MLLGCIGDDFTGSSDLANTLARGGMRVRQFCEVPQESGAGDVEAGVVALKTRSLPAPEAVAQSLAALEWLIDTGCRQFFFKYCSTFDSTPAGNIGPVTEALAERLSARKVIVCPAFPATGRTVYQGHLFVGGRLLSESGMEAHPLTPMTDPDIRRWLKLQTKGSIGHVALPEVMAGVDAIEATLQREDEAGHRLIVVDAVSEADLRAIGRAAQDLPLVTGGSGVALGLPDNFTTTTGGGRSRWQGACGPGAVLSGSCSQATRHQVDVHKRSHPAFEVDADAVMTETITADDVVAWMMAHENEMPLVYSSADPETVRAAQARHGREALAAAIEGLFADLAHRLVGCGFTRLVAAGGETSGAVVSGIGCAALDIGPEIDPGVPAMRVSGRPLALALKSGNFGGDDFFERALAMLGSNG